MNQQTGYIPKEQRKKVVLLADDLRFPTGIGTVARSIVLGTAHHFNWVCVGAGINHPDADKRLDLSADTNKISGLTDASVHLIPFNGYGNMDLIREIIKHEKPDAIFFITDPRYYDWLFKGEHEVRQHCPLIYLQIWDDEPGPLYNKSFYRSCDALLAISKQTENLNKIVLGGDYADDVYIRYVPHGINPNQFFPIRPGHERYEQLQDFKKQLFKGKDYDFMLLFNSRNIRRKQIPDTLLAFKTFLDRLPKEQADKCCFVLHTQPIDDNGTDLYAVREMLFGHKQEQVIFSDGRVSEEHLNLLYNAADATILLSSNEGWGLSITESLMAGTMVIGNVTGGIQDQARFEDEEGNWIECNEKFSSNHFGKYKKCGAWFIPVFPNNMSLQGSVPTPYIMDDRVDFREAADAIHDAYCMAPFRRTWCGDKGREWVMSDKSMMRVDKMCENVIESIDDVLETWEPREKYRLLKVEKRPLKYLENPVSI